MIAVKRQFWVKLVHADTVAVMFEPADSLVVMGIWHQPDVLAGTPVVQQRCIYNGKQPEDGRTLSDYTFKLAAPYTWLCACGEVSPWCTCHVSQRIASTMAGMPLEYTVQMHPLSHARNLCVCVGGGGRATVRVNFVLLT